MIKISTITVVDKENRFGDFDNINKMSLLERNFFLIKWLIEKKLFVKIEM